MLSQEANWVTKIIEIDLLQDKRLFNGQKHPPHPPTCFFSKVVHQCFGVLMMFALQHMYIAINKVCFTCSHICIRM